MIALIFKASTMLKAYESFFMKLYSTNNTQTVFRDFQSKEFKIYNSPQHFYRVHVSGAHCSAGTTSRAVHDQQGACTGGDVRIRSRLAGDFTPLSDVKLPLSFCK